MQRYAQAILTVLSLINPFICAVIFKELTADRSLRDKVADALKATFTVVVILSVAALTGAKLLHMFGVSLDAFQSAGGLVLIWMGFFMLSGRQSSPSSTVGRDVDSGPASLSDSASAATGQTSLMPLILFAASPGTITGVITLSVAHSRMEIPVTALVAIAVAMALTLLVLILFARRAGDKTPGGLHDLATRFMGLIVLAMGVQFILTGTKAFFG